MTSLRITIDHPNADAAARWQRSLAALLPGARCEAWRPGAEPADYAIAWYPAAEFFAGQPRLRALFSAGAGVDHLLGHPGLPAQLPIVRLEDAGMAQQMIEYCLLEIVRLQRRVDDYAALQRERRWQQLAAMPRPELTVGVFGLGVLGEPLARALAGFGYPVRAFSRTPKHVAGIDCFDARHGLQAFLEGCRVLILMAPLTKDTRGLFDAQRLGWLPEGAWLINVARGALVVEPDLLAALDAGRLAGATLDVFAREPLPDDHPFWQHPKLRVTPHVSAVTLPEESAKQVAAKIRALERNEAIGGVVERGRGY